MQRVIGLLLIVLGVGLGFYVFSLRPPTSLIDFARIANNQGSYIPEPQIYYLLSFFTIHVILGVWVLLGNSVNSTSIAIGVLQIDFLLASIVALIFLPMFLEVTSGSVVGDAVTTRSGNYFVENTIQCFLDRNFSIADECEPKGGLQGKFIFGAVFVSAVAAILGVLGLLPVIGRVTSAITTLAGVIVIAAIGFFILNMMGSKEGLEGVQWGSYLAGGGGLLTLVSGLSGMRGR